MEALLVGLFPAAICVGGMFLCMRMMSGGAKKTHAARADATGPRPRDAEVAELREEIARLRAKVELRDPEPSS
ncbi:MAG: hypothetical protein ACRDUY_11745 [Nitriliruptorales bacterium]